MWFVNQAEVDLFHAVVMDLKEGRHPGNRISVPLLRQATIMKRNRAGFYSLRHAVRACPPALLLAPCLRLPLSATSPVRKTCMPNRATACLLI